MTSLTTQALLPAAAVASGRAIHSDSRTEAGLLAHLLDAPFALYTLSTALEGKGSLSNEYRYVLASFIDVNAEEFERLAAEAFPGPDHAETIAGIIETSRGLAS